METPPDAANAFLAEGSEVCALMRALDWSLTPLGPLAGWPLSLRTVMGLLLGSKYPCLSLGARTSDSCTTTHTSKFWGKTSIGAWSRLKDVWSEAWPQVYPLIAQALEGIASYREKPFLSRSE
jgi:hypothetical protein